VRGCAEATHDRPKTWINDEIVRLYAALHRLGFAHSVETWRDGELVGGLYGVALGAAFFGESMYSRVTDASKVALTQLVARLRLGGFRLLDTQFVTEHLQQFGAVEISRAQYHRRLAAALPIKAYLPREPLAGAAVVSALAVEHADVVDRILQRRERRARREHPAAEHLLRYHGVALALAHFVDLQEGGALRLLLGRVLDAGAHGDDERAEAHGFADRRIEFRDPRRGLVEPLQHGDRLGPRRSRRDKQSRQQP